MIIENEGTYTLVYTATDSCGKTTTVNRELVVEEPILVYGAEWAGGESSVWTRTDAAALFTDPVPQMSDGNGGWTTGSSPFDDIMPWSGMEIVEDAEAGTLVKIPKFYYKWTRNGSAMKLQIADSPQTGFFTSPAHADRGDGVGERDVVYVGRYHCSSTNYKSITGVKPKASMTRANFRTNIHALGADVWQYDFAMYWTIAMLYLVEFANWNSQAEIGYGCGTGNSLANEGETDSMTYHTGTNATTLTTYSEIQYRHIEGLWSNLRDFVDGIYFSGQDVYVIKNPSDFSDTTGGTNVGRRPTNSNAIMTFTDPSSIDGFEYALYASSVMDSAGNKYVCDKASYSSGLKTLCVGGDLSNHTQDSGLFQLNGTIAYSNTSGITGSRLMKLPSA